MFSICGPLCETLPYHVDENVSGRRVGQHWFYKCLTIAETPALHYFSCWSTTKFLPGQQFSASLISSFSVDNSGHWFLNPGQLRDHTRTSLSRRGDTEGRRVLLCRFIPKCWLEHQNRMRLLTIRWGKGGRRITQAKWTDL